MKSLLNAVCEKLRTETGNTIWIGNDNRQIDCIKGEPLVEFPCILVKIELENCEDVRDKVQQCNAKISIRAVVEDDYTLLETIYKAMQGFESEEFTPLSRRSQVKEVREDHLCVYQFVFESTYLDYSA